MIVAIESEKVFSVIPAKAGIQEKKKFWTPAFAGVTTLVVSYETVSSDLKKIR
jgi:hypothetical protein